MTVAVSIHEDNKDDLVKASRLIDMRSSNDITTAGAATYTAAQVLAGIIVRDCAGSGRTDVLPTAALLVAAMHNPRIGEVIDLMIVNGSDGAETITIAAGNGGGFNSLQQATSKDIAQNVTKTLKIRITGVVSGSEAYVVYM